MDASLVDSANNNSVDNQKSQPPDYSILNINTAPLPPFAHRKKSNKTDFYRQLLEFNSSLQP